ncbi:MAG TPA: 3-hydroxyacyl-CoA dehydrogenase NAD-binding domain-containing protein [Alphaproteobacteria bacterium]|nr:3-hydroxyacyl-CoA dehydrogenase NAD-binding domain-containing protein [Alphaproteobacteria bacterium]
MAIKKAAVIGAGVMGAGIAAHLANAGIEVELLDIVPKGAEDRDVIAKGAIQKMLKTNPAPLMHKRNAKKINPGNTEDNLDRLKDCDLIIEAVLEDPTIKANLFKKIDENRKPGSIVASNTSTIPLQTLIDGQSEQFKKDFVITHFFNPPRYMPLLELVTSAHNSPEMVADVTKFMDEKMGKGVVVCNDTPGFIANRIGTFWIQASINEAIDRKLTVEEADAIVGRPMGIPKTGIFGLVDLVGLDLMPHISKSLTEKLPADDGYVKIARQSAVIDKMIADGYTGRKGKGGFYRLNDKREKMAVDLDTGAERPATKPKMKAADNARKGGLKGLVETKDKGGDYAWAVLKQTLCYAAEHVHTISGNITDVDQAMKLGYNWKDGPFEMLDKMGVDYFINRLKAEGEKVPAFIEQAAGKKFYKTENGKLQYLTKDGDYAEVKRPEGVLLLSDIKRASKPVVNNTKNIPGIGKMGAALWDAGDGVLCLEFTSKMNSLDLYTLKTIHQACDIIEKGSKKGKDGQPFKALVIHNEGDDFSVGANIGVAMLAAKAKQYWIVDKMVKGGQDALKRLKYAKFPVVSAPSGKALGGGCEVLLHSHHVQAHAETYMGLVEVGVGLLPAWGGSTELMTRATQSKRLPKGPMPPVATVFETISTAKVGLSAFEGKDLLYLRETDGVTMNKSRLLADAKKKALEMTVDFKPEVPHEMTLPGPAGAAALNMAVDGFFLKGQATSYDVVVSDKVGRVLTGGDKAGPGVKVSQDYLRALERKHFMELVHDPRTVARIETMLKTGKPLREKPVAGLRAQQLRDDAEHKDGFFARVVTKPLRRIFGKAADKPANDNAGLTPDKKAKMNWPTIKKPKQG